MQSISDILEEIPLTGNQGPMDCIYISFYTRYVTLSKSYNLSSLSRMRGVYCVTPLGG